MNLKKLAAGSGYEYLTKQVAAADSTELGSTKLVDYYAAKGEEPGRWVGSGLAGIDGIEAGDIVTAEQMQHLFGEGCHPVTGKALGRAFRKDGVAGFDLTFSPAKSVSTLWAVAPPEIAKEIRSAHDEAVADAIAFLESHAIFTREGTDGVRQVETRGLIAAAFTHRDSRAGDPDLHTHVAVSNKVQTRQGKWLSIYGNVLYDHIVAASEAYNTALEHRLRARLGVQFVDAEAGPRKRAIREIAGVDPMLCARWSRRRHAIEDRTDELTVEFTDKYGRPPSTKESIVLAQRANLETRAPKHEPRSEAEQREAWLQEAATDLGRSGVQRMIDAALDPEPAPLPQVTTSWLSEAADRIITELEEHRAMWQSWHLYAEAQRQVRDVDVPAEQVAGVVEHLVDAAGQRLINLTPDRDPITEPNGLRRSDDTSVYRHTGADHFTSERMLAAEERIITAAGTHCPAAMDPIDVELALMEYGLTGTHLNAGQQELVRGLVSDPRQVALALAPAGSGKTTAMRALAQVCVSLGYDTVGLAPSAAAAAVLEESTGIPANTLALFDHARQAGLDPGLGTHSMVIIDEAGMADTPTLDRVIAHCAEAGARVRLIGDDRQLAAVGAGGVLRDIAETHDAQRLDEVVRFVDPAEAQASIDLRAGDHGALGFYLDHDRVHPGAEETCLAEVLDAWTSDVARGRDTLMLAPTRDLVARLNRAARSARLRDTVSDTEVDLADGNRASTGDVILTRHNDRRLGISATDWVRNGDRWTVTGVGDDGSLTARHVRTQLHVTLPAAYVAQHVELGYATTVHSAQGSTADVMHGILTGNEDRQLLYTMLTRGREENHVHLVLDETVREEEQFLPGIDEQLTAVEILDRIVGRDGAAVSASTQLSHGESAATRLHEATQRYVDAVDIAARQGAGESTSAGPLPWLSGIPEALGPEWAEYLNARADRITELATVVGRHPELPDAVSRVADVLTPELRRSIAIWRAANGVPDDDRRLLGPRTGDPVSDTYARRLSRRVDELHPPSVRRWQERITEVLGRPPAHGDPVLDLAHDLDRLEREGVNAGLLLRRAATLRKPLPEDHTVEALRYRVQRMAARWQSTEARQPQVPDRSTPGLGL